MAQYKDICYLGDIREIENSYGDVVETVVYSSNHVFCNIKSVGYREFYEASAQGMKPEIILEMYSIEYNMQEYVLYNNVAYKVIRTYNKGVDKIEITLQRGVNQYRTGVKKEYMDGLFYLDGSHTLDGVY